MKSIIFTLISILTFTFGANAQLFKVQDIDKIANYVVEELSLTGKTSENVKAIHADYGSKMRSVINNKSKGLPAKQKELQSLTDQMDSDIKAVLPKNKINDYETVAAHYRKRGINTSALGNTQSKTESTQRSQQLQKVEEIKDVSEQLKQEFIDKLKVNDAQANQLVKITFEHELKKKVINQTLKTDAVARAAKMNELNTDTNNKVRKILNAQQYKTYLGILIKHSK